MEQIKESNPVNCNRCPHKQEMSRHWDVGDYCKLSGYKIGYFDASIRCPLNNNKIADCRQVKGDNTRV